MKNIIASTLFLFGQIVSAELDNSQFIFLKKMVEINSGSENPKGLNELGDLISQEFLIRNLVVTKIDVAPNNPAAHSVYQIRRPTSDNKITLMGHLDTVFTPESTFRKLSIEGAKIIGPGVIDMKGGVLLIRDLIVGLPDSALEHLQIIFNDDEEIDLT